MNLDGKKTIIGALFLAVTVFTGNIEPLFQPETLTIVQAITGGIGTFLAAIGIGHKIDKIGK